MNLLNRNKNILISIFSLVCLFFLIFKNNFQSVFLIFILGSLFVFYYLVFNIEIENLETKIKKLESYFFENKINSYLLILFLLIVTQSSNLNYETIDSDINSYLVASQDVLRGNLPYENQWESKTPMLYIFYSFIILLSGKNLFVFKILNDLILFCICILILKIIKHHNPNEKILGLSSVLLYICLVSFDWAQTEYSEIYVTLFLSIAYLVFLKSDNNIIKVFLSGLVFSIATLINQGSLLFIVPFMMLIFIKKINILKSLAVFSFGVLIPHLIVSILYITNGLMDIYVMTLFTIPLDYTQTDFSLINEAVVFLKSVYEYNFLLFFILVNISVFLICSAAGLLVNRHKTDEFLKINIGYLFFFMSSIVFYLVAAKGYFHHTLFGIFFFVFLANQFIDIKIKAYLAFTILICSLSIFFSSFKSSYDNLTNYESTYNNYPLKQLSKEIDTYFDYDYSVLSLDYNLILFYLDKPNFSYIVHSRNHFEEFILNNLKELNKVEDDYIRWLIDQEPDVILCSGTQIINGEVTQLNEFNCEVSDYNLKYKKLNTDIYRYNPALNFYPDPYREVGVYLKINK